jgi:hypothetical protein
VGGGEINRGRKEKRCRDKKNLEIKRCEELGSVGGKYKESRKRDVDIKRIEEVGSEGRRYKEGGKREEVETKNVKKWEVRVGDTRREEERKCRDKKCEVVGSEELEIQRGWKERRCRDKKM